MIKVLELCASLDGGGVERLLFDFSTRMMDDVQFDFVVTSPTEGILEQELQERGSKIFHIHQMSGDVFGYIGNLNRIIKQGNYDIVHDHMNQASMGSMFSAWLNRVPVRIAHSHTYIYGEKKIRKLKRKIMALISSVFATNLCACGQDAAKWMWGKKSNKCKIVRNAINLDDFYFNNKKRIEFRELFGLNDKFVIGNVARLSEEKNQLFLLEVFRIVFQKMNKARLVFVGQGEMETELKKYVKKFGLEECVLFLGVRSDVPDLLNMMDVFVLPSKYEGFPVTLVEAQANGLPIVASDKITNECVLSDSFTSLSIEKSASDWATEILNQPKQRQKVDKRLYAYHIDEEAEALEKFYKSSLIKKG